MKEDSEMRFRRTSALLGVALAAVALFAAGAMAGDGTIDILPDGITTCTISNPGSYRLTGDVTVSGEITAISVTANDVTIDLGGHTITGPGAISTPNVHGIDLNSTSRVTIFNGTIRDYNETVLSVLPSGIFGGTSSAVWIRDVRTSSCTQGVIVDDDSRVERCVFDGGGVTGARGVVLNGNASVLQDCQAVNNVVGIQIGGGGFLCLVKDNFSSNNSSTGIALDTLSGQNVFVGNVCVKNTLFGFTQTGGAHFLADNYAALNGTNYSGVASVTSQAAANERGDNLTP